MLYRDLLHHIQQMTETQLGMDVIVFTAGEYLWPETIVMVKEDHDESEDSFEDGQHILI